MSLEWPGVVEPPAEVSERVLLVEDDVAIQNMLVDALRECGFNVAIAASGVELDRAIGRERPNLVLLDLMLPGEDSRAICARLRSATPNLPIIMVTALDDDIDRIVGLEIGADDYVTKPFNTRELVARIRALLRRTRASGGQRTRPGPLSFAGWLTYPTERKLVDPQGVHVTNASAEFDFLLAFCTHPGEVLSREQLLELTHGGIAGPVERSVDVHVSPYPPEDRTQSRRSRLHQDGAARRLHIHAAGGVRMTRFLRRLKPTTAAGQLIGVIVAAVWLGVGLTSAVMLYLVYSGGVGPSHDTMV
jgi:two-component system OmpR family response regulator